MATSRSSVSGWMFGQSPNSDEDVSGKSLECTVGHHHCMPGASRLVLIGCQGMRQELPDLRLDASIRWSSDDDRPFRFELRSGGKHMPDQRASGGNMHDFRERRFHARPMAGGQNHDGKPGHPATLNRRFAQCCRGEG